MSAREEIFASIPPGYSGWRHFLLVNAVALSAIALALSRLRAPSWVEVLAVPLGFVVANAIEWQVHKDVLHRRVRGLDIIYQRHALTHHVAFHADSMAAPSPREWRWVLFPAPLIVGLCAGSALLAALLWPLSHNAALLLFSTWVGFYLLYEWCHLSYHQPPGSFIGRRPLVAALRRHHQLHHHPALARRANFNITFPLWDWVRGTVAGSPPPGPPGKESD